MLRRWRVLLYLFYAVPLVLFLAINMPVYLNADETNHLMRAETVLDGQLIGTRTADGRSGGEIDDNMLSVLRIQWPLLSVPEARATHAITDAAWAIKWGGPRTFADIPNTIIYPPTLYAPVIAGLGLGKLLDLSIAQSFVVARLANGLVSILIAALALHLAARGWRMLFAVLLLPMSLAQMASASQDALLIAGGALLVALVSRPVAQERPATNGEFISMAVLITLLSMSRPTNFAFLLFLLPLAPRLVGRVSLASVLPAMLALVLGWILWMALEVQVQQVWGDVVPSTSGQVRHLLENPLDFFRALYGTWTTGAGYWGTTVMMLGWLGWSQFNIVLTGWFYTAALWMLGGALLGDMLEEGHHPPRFAALALAVVLISALGIYFLQYLTFSAVGGDEVSGVQGRYFLALLATLGLAVPSLARFLPDRVARHARDVLTVTVLAFPLVTLALLPKIVIARAVMG